MAHTLKRFIPLVILVGFFVAFGWYLVVNLDDFRILLDLNPVFVALAAVGHLGVVALNGVFTRRILLAFGKDVSYQDSFFVSLISSIGNFFLPMQSGAGVRAVYLKRKYQLAYNDFLSIFAGTYAINFFLSSALGIMSLFFLRHQTGPGQLLVIGAAFAAILAGSTFVAITPISGALLRYVLRLIPSKKLSLTGERVQEGWELIVADRRLVAELIVITATSMLLSVGLFIVELRSVGLETGVWSVLFYASIGSIVLILNITPASLGIREAVLVFSAAALGLTVPQILSVALIDRGVKFTVLAVSWLVLHTQAKFSFKTYTGIQNQS